MTIRKRAGAVALGLVGVVLVGWLPIVAQEPAPKSATPPAPVQKKQIRRVPDYFGQIGLTPEQKTNIYAVLNKRHDKIEALEKQIAAERAEMIAECEAMLNKTQKTLLDDLRKAAAEPKPTSKPSEPPKASN